MFSPRLFSFNKHKNKILDGLDLNIILAEDTVKDVINLSHTSEETYYVFVMKLIQMILFRINIFLYTENQFLC